MRTHASLVAEDLESTTHMLENLVSDLRKHGFKESTIENVRAVIARNRHTLAIASVRVGIVPVETLKLTPSDASLSPISDEGKFTAYVFDATGRKLPVTVVHYAAAVEVERALTQSRRLAEERLQIQCGLEQELKRLKPQPQP